MRIKRFAVSVMTLVFVVTGTVAASVVPARAGAVAAVGAAATCSDQTVDSDARLGPAALPTQGQIGVIVHGYQRFAGLTEQQFLTRYWDPSAFNGAGGWRYPPENGFLLNANGQPIEYVVPLGVGQRLDRFGSERGGFLAPLGTPFGQRALPPMSLDNVSYDPAHTCNYHLYAVIKSFKVESGPIAPGFGQMGYGRQYQLIASLLPGSPMQPSVMWLVDHGYLQRLN